MNKYQRLAKAVKCNLRYMQKHPTWMRAVAFGAKPWRR